MNQLTTTSAIDPYLKSDNGTFNDDLGNAGYKRCVIYTRKSSQEGLEQDFNSLHAQREACEAYIQSQRHEGWRLLKGEEHHYDDPGLSGGNMERPGLQNLLGSIQAGLVDVVVVYKVDRLTRALSDFAHIIDVMDSNEVSFVSVTQSFNTTSSMGRLTLNVLLSFAQFEREVTAERIRDKIAASKRKGIWMGGPVPLGYSSMNKRLIVDEEEAKTVQTIFETYLRTRSINDTKKELDRRKITTRPRNRKNGSIWGGIAFSHGAIQSILRNPIYIGQLRHKSDQYEGEHHSIIERETFQRANNLLDQSRGGNKRKTSNKEHQPTNGRLLTGLLYDSAGFAMTPTHTNKKGVRYRYYVSTAIAKNQREQAGSPHRIPVGPIEKAVTTALVQRQSTARGWQDDQTASNQARGNCPTINRDDIVQLVKRIELTSNGAIIFLTAKGNHIHKTAKMVLDIHFSQPPRRQMRAPMMSVAQTKEADQQKHKQQANQRILAAIARATHWYNQLKNGETKSILHLASQEQRSVRSIRLNLNLAWVAPDIVQAAMDNQLDATLSPTELARNLPSNWDEQRKLVGLS